MSHTQAKTHIGTDTTVDITIVGAWPLTPKHARLLRAFVENLLQASMSADDYAKSFDRPPKALTPGATIGKLGGEARAKALTPEERSAISSKAAKARWKKP